MQTTVYRIVCALCKLFSSEDSNMQIVLGPNQNVWIKIEESHIACFSQNTISIKIRYLWCICGCVTSSVFSFECSEISVHRLCLLQTMEVCCCLWSTLHILLISEELPGHHRPESRQGICCTQDYQRRAHSLHPCHVL